MRNCTDRERFYNYIDGGETRTGSVQYICLWCDRQFCMLTNILLLALKDMANILTTRGKGLTVLELLGMKLDCSVVYTHPESFTFHIFYPWVPGVPEANMFKYYGLLTLNELNGRSKFVSDVFSYSHFALRQYYQKFLGLYWGYRFHLWFFSLAYN